MAARDETSETGMALFVLTSASVERTHALGRALGEMARTGDVILLKGELGAGKTAFTPGHRSGTRRHRDDQQPDLHHPQGV